MCGRYSLAAPGDTLAQLRSRFPLGESVEIRRRYNVCPGDEVVSVTTTREGEPRGDLLRWGLVPHWAQDPSVGYKMINARAETVAERPAFRDSFRGRRCLIIADGFYEWQKRPGRSKLPWHVTRSDGAPFAFAGLWAVWHGPNGEKLRTCTIITTEANSALTDIHPRMPVMLPGPDAERAWLDPGTPQHALHELLVPPPPVAIRRRAVGPAVNDPRNDGPECLADAPEEGTEPATLF